MSGQSPLESPITLRAANLSDAEAIARIERDSFAHPGEQFGLRRVRYLLESPRAGVIVAEVDGRVLGWAAGLFSWPKHSPSARVYALAVHPDGRGKKLGWRLFKQIIAMLASRGAKTIFLEVRSDNTSAITLYERAGFRPCGTLPNFFGPGLDAIRMSLDLED